MTKHNSKTGELTDKQAAFVREYMKDSNAKQAAIRAGYSEKVAEMQGSRLMSYAKVKGAVASEQARMAASADITVAEVLDSIRETIVKAAAAGEHANVLRGNELLGRYLAMFTDKIQTEAKVVSAKPMSLGAWAGEQDKGAKPSH